MDDDLRAVVDAAQNLHFKLRALAYFNFATAGLAVFHHEETTVINPACTAAVQIDESSV